jgi:hypothetical protein
MRDMTDTVTIKVAGRRNCIFYSDRLELTKRKNDKLVRTLYYADIENMRYSHKPRFKSIFDGILYGAGHVSKTFAIIPKNWNESYIIAKISKEEFNKIREIVGDSIKIKVPQGSNFVQLHKDSDF